MQLSLKGLQDAAAWQAADVTLPVYDVAASSAASRAAPRWAHVGVGNIFRCFLGSIADDLLASDNGAENANCGIICLDTHGFDTIGKIYTPHDNLTLAVTLNIDGSTTKRVLGSLAEALNADFRDRVQWERLLAVFAAPSLQLASFTITEKGYALTDSTGAYLPQVAADIEAGTARPTTAMAIVTTLLHWRFTHGATPLALVSMDNCSQNGDKLRAAVTRFATEWQQRGFVDDEFCRWLSESGKISFPWTMIDKITPRPAQTVADELTALGIEGMQPSVTNRGSYVAPFVNAEAPQYLVIEDDFPNGRPPLESAHNAGVYLTDRTTVNAVERMKVTACLNPLHTALAVYGCLLGYERIAAEMQDADLTALVRRIADEGMAVVADPHIINPAAFAREVLEERLPNRFLPDTPQRIATDTSQKVGIRYGETIRSYVARDGTATSLRAIPLAIAGWLRYLLAIDDAGAPFTPSADPLLATLQQQLANVRLGTPASAGGALQPILANERIFGCNLYDVGIGTRVEALFAQLIAGTGAVRRTLHEAATQTA